MEEEKGMETTPEVIETPEPQPTEGTPPTAEETLQKEMAELKQKYEQTEKGLRSAQATLTQKDRLLKEKEDLRSDIDLLKGMIKVLATARNSEDDAYDLEEAAKKKNPNIDEKFKELESQFKNRQREEEQKAFVSRVGDIQKRTETLKLDESSEEYLDIRDLALAGKFDRAEAKLKKMEAKQVETPDKKETAEDMEARIRKELEKKILEERGLLDSETGQPYGGSVKSYTRQQIDDMPMEQYAKELPEINKAIAAGKVK